MKQSEMLACLDYFDRNGIWAMELSHFRLYFYNESEQTLKVALGRHSKNGIIKHIARGIYVNPRAVSKSECYFVAEYISNLLRSKATSYLSLESVLSENGKISQIPNRLTFISTQKSREFRTPYGIIEYVHTSKNPKDIHENCYYDEARSIWIANEEQAIDDIYRHNRSVDLYEEQLQKDKDDGFI